ncbi:MAG TPA: hypothetical protein VMT52_18905 [Planctomycetota bacterium]|nr:hypothetical protein [Planctomycetota bacterium]
MEESIRDLLGTDVDFPALSREVVPENVQALRRITAGQRGLCLLYSDLELSTGGEARFAVRLLKRDCDSRLLEVVTAGVRLLGALGVTEKELEVLPSPPQISAIAGRCQNASPAGIVGLLSAFAARALISGSLVPWVSDTQEVFEHFKTSLEAEDQHLAVVELVGRLIA